MYKYLEDRMYSETPKLLIFREKHGTQHFTTYNATELSMVLLSVLSERLEDDWYMDALYGDQLPKGDSDPEQMDIFNSNELPKTDKEQVQEIIDLARSDVENAVIEAGALAYVFLDIHGGGDYEYEEFEIKYLDSPTFSLTPA